jgi:hypothetical protein
LSVCTSILPAFVMAGLVPAIHVFLLQHSNKKDVDARDERGHDESTHKHQNYREVSSHAGARLLCIDIAAPCP